MSIIEWVIWEITVTFKFYLISKGILGYELRKSYWRFIAFLYLAVGISVIIYSGCNKIYYTSLWGIIFLHLFFEGKLLKKMQMILLQYVSITVIDTMIWSMFALWQDESIGLSDCSIEMISEVIGAFFWLGLFFMGKRYWFQIRDVLYSLQTRYYLLIICILLGSNFNMVNNVVAIRGEMTGVMGYAAYVISNIVFILILIVGGLVVKVLYAWQQLQLEKEYSQKKVEVQRKYYVAIREKEQHLRCFQHDFNRHINALQILCQKKQIDCIERYVKDLSGVIRTTNIIYTGNEIVDYYINELVCVCEKDKQFSYEIMGRFSNTLLISDSDLSILFGNALDNAREELQKCNGSCRFEMVIRNYQGTLFVRICNTTKNKQGRLLVTEKADKNNHGYGIKNMCYVVQKYKGDILWTYEDDMFVLEIEI